MTWDKYRLADALAHIIDSNREFTTWTVSTPHLLLLLKKAVEEEREACAEVCESVNDGTPYNQAEECAAAIRARGQE